MDTSELGLLRAMFVAAAIWNLCGGVLGYFNTGETFLRLFGRAAADPVLLSVFQGSAGTTFVYFFGYLIVAFDPLRHTGIAIVGGIGKVGFAIQMLKFYLTGLANAHALIVIVGDLIFCVLFLTYFYRLLKTGHRLI